MVAKVAWFTNPTAAQVDALPKEYTRGLVSWGRAKVAILRLLLSIISQTLIATKSLV